LNLDPPERLYVLIDLKTDLAQAKSFLLIRFSKKSHLLTLGDKLGIIPRDSALFGVEVDEVDRK